MNGLSPSNGLWPAASAPLDTSSFSGGVSADRAGGGAAANALAGWPGVGHAASATLAADVEPEARGLSVAAHAERVLGHLLSQPAGDTAAF